MCYTNKEMDISTIVLTYNEEKHIERCLRNALKISKKVYVIDSPSTDRTQELCKSFSNVELIEHFYPGNQAEQFNWALSNLDIHTKWILRLDADEYLSDELIDEIRVKLPLLEDGVTGIHLKRKCFFLNRLMKHGPTINLLRLFRTGHGRCEMRLMDEHLVLNDGLSVTFNNLFYDHSLIELDDWIKKHLNYAKRNTAEVLNMKYGLRANDNSLLTGQASFKRKLKSFYYNLPLFVRPFIYFFYRYFIQGSFLDGREGFLWCYYQARWYPALVDTHLWQIKKECGKDVDKIKAYLKREYGIVM